MEQFHRLETRITFTSSARAYPENVLFGSPEFELALPLPLDLGTGHMRTLRLSEKLGTLDSRIQSVESTFTTTATSSNNLMRFTYALEELRSRVTIGRQQLSAKLDEGLGGFSYLPVPVRNEVCPGTTMHLLSIIVDPSFFHPLMGDMDPSAASLLDAILSSPERPYVRRIATFPGMIFAANQIVHCPYAGSLKLLFVEGEVFELIAANLQQLAHAECEHRSPIRLTNSDIERLHHAREIMSQNFTQPPSITELARTVGMSAKKLKIGFKEVFGTTVFGHVRNRRLETARQMLSEGSSVTVVSLDVGYSSLSHFAAAFKAEFGVPPHTFRKMCSREIDRNE